MAKQTFAKVGDRVKPAEHDAPTGIVKWVRGDGLVVLVNWDDGSGCDHWFTSHLDEVRA